jgi:MerR family transcriptional regulator, light-induced transcriptional regulator
MQLREAADTLGVHYQTAYAWVRQRALPARKTGRGYEVDDADVRALAARRHKGSLPARAIGVRDWPAQADQLYAAIAHGQETRARHWLDRLAAGVTVTDLCERVIAPALRRIGADWACGQVSIAQEHRASAICERLIALRYRQPPGRPRGTAVVATPPGERHGLPALMAAACLREDHWLVHHLAADLPVAEVTRLARDAAVSLVVFSSATQDGARRARDATREVAAANPQALVLAGQAGDTLPELARLARAARNQGVHHRKDRHELSESEP